MTSCVCWPVARLLIRQIDNNVVSVARSLVFAHLFDEGAQAADSSKADPTGHRLDTLTALLFYLSFSPVMPKTLLGEMTKEIAALLDRLDGKAAEGGTSRFTFALDEAYGSEVRYVLAKWIEGAKLKMSKVLRVTKAAAKAAAEQAAAALAAANKGRKVDEANQLPAGVLAGCELEYKAFGTLGLLRPPDWVLNAEPADVKLAFDRLTVAGKSEIRTEGERQRSEDCVHDRVEAAWALNPTFWDPYRAPEDFSLRYGDPLRAIGAELAGFKLASKHNAADWHWDYLYMAFTAYPKAPPTVINFGGKRLADRFFDYGIGDQPLMSDRPYHRVVLSDTLDYSDGHLGALIALQQLPLAVNASISLEERVFKVRQNARGSA